MMIIWRRFLSILKMGIEYREPTWEEQLNYFATKTFRGWFRRYILKRCPRCGNKLWKVGWWKPETGQRYKCPDKNCGWATPPIGG